MNPEKRSEYVSLLHQELRERNLKNPKYSLRAFARDLGVSPSRLSEVLSGKGEFSRQVAFSIAEKISLDENKSKLFLQTLLAEKAKSEGERNQAKKELEKMDVYGKADEILNQEFSEMSEWYYLGVWNFLLLEKGNDFTGICHEFPDLKQDTIHRVLRVLLRLDLIEEREGSYVATKERLKALYQFSSFAVRNYHKSILAKAIRCLDEHNIEERYFQNAIFCISPENYEYITDKIKDFVSELSVELKEKQENVSPSSVYSLGLQCFRLNKTFNSEDK